MERRHQRSYDFTGVKENWVHAKKKTYGYKERDEEKRRVFLNRLSSLTPERVVYMDESGMDHRDNDGYAYCEKGKRYHDLKTGQRKGRINMIAALHQAQLFATFTLEVACNREVFELWLETCLIRELKPGQVVIMDNASFHKGGSIEELIQAAGCELLYLPPYSPDLNKIERAWSWLKSRIRPKIDQYDTLREAVESVLKVS